jgi:hypothetical protein
LQIFTLLANDGGEAAFDRTARAGVEHGASPTLVL